MVGRPNTSSATRFVSFGKSPLGASCPWNLIFWSPEIGSRGICSHNTLTLPIKKMSTDPNHLPMRTLPCQSPPHPPEHGLRRQVLPPMGCHHLLEKSHGSLHPSLLLLSIPCNHQVCLACMRELRFPRNRGDGWEWPVYRRSPHCFFDVCC